MGGGGGGIALMPKVKIKLVFNHVSNIRNILQSTPEP